MRRQSAYFLSLEQRLSGCPGVSALETNPVTGSVLVMHTSSIAAIAEYAEHKDLFRIEAIPSARIPAQAPFTVAVAEKFTAFDKEVSKLSGGGLDVPSLAFLAFVGMAVNQMREGHTIPPAITLLWYAASVLLMAQKR